MLVKIAVMACRLFRRIALRVIDVPRVFVAHIHLHIVYYTLWGALDALITEWPLIIFHYNLSLKHQQ